MDTCELMVCPAASLIPGMLKDDIAMENREEVCTAALRCFDQGAHGISTYNFFGHSLYSPLARKKGFPDCAHPSPRRGRQYRSGLANAKTEIFVHSFLSSPKDIQQCLRARPEVGAGRCKWQTPEAKHLEDSI